MLRNHKNKAKNRILIPETKQKDKELPISMDLSTEITKMFDVNRRKSQRISEYMCELIRKTKRRASKSAKDEIRYTPLRRPLTGANFKKFAERAPYTEISRFQEKNILKKVQAKELENIHKHLLKDMMKEVRDEFVKITHSSGMSTKIKYTSEQTRYSIEPYKFQGRTESYQKFVDIRNEFKYKWILHLPVIKKIHRECIKSLPNELFSLNFQQPYELQNLKDLLEEKVQHCSEQFYDFYKKIVYIVDKEEQKLPYNTPQQLTYLKACTGIFTLHISKTIAQTLTYVENVTSSKDIRPYLVLNVIFQNGLVLSPTAQDVISILCSFLDKIVDVGRGIHVLERHRVKGFENKYLSIFITDVFINKCKTSIETHIKKHYEPIMKFLNTLSSGFEEIYNDMNFEDFYVSISDINYETGCDMIKYRREYVNKILFIPDHEFFRIGKLYLIDYSEKLHQGLSKNINAIFEKLTSQHYWEVNDLCETFGMIKTRAQLKPLTTEELIETGKYMTWIKNEHLDEISSRVYNSLRSLCLFIDLGILTEEHIAMNCKVIHWLEDILPIIDEHAIIFDQLKFDAEEKLQKVVEDVNLMIKDVFPLLVIIDDMDDISRVRSYLHKITLHMSKIKEIEVQINWINTEEVVLSFPKSVYSQYEDLNNYVCPFYHLLKLCLDVQRSISVWLDGSFDKLCYESTNEAADKFHKELSSIYKDYRKKLRQAQDENLPVRFKGTVDDPDILNWPAPLKLCGKALRLIEEFKPSVNVMKIICNPHLKTRHWDAMSEIAGRDISPNAGTTLRKMIQIDFQSKLTEYEIISSGATKEKQLKDDLKKLKLQWKDMKFELDDYRGLQILSNLDDIEILINDQAINILVMKSSVFVKPNEQSVTKFYKQLQQIKDTVQIWREVQSILINLRPILSSQNIETFIPTECQYFENSIKTYTSLIESVQKTPEVIQIATTEFLGDSIKSTYEQLEMVRKGVTTYLEILKNCFSRLYFVSDDELIGVISNPNYLVECKHFFRKIFQAVHELIIRNEAINGICNSHLEYFQFVNRIEVKHKPFEQVCSQLNDEIKTSLKTSIAECFKIYKTTSIHKLCERYPIQIVQIIVHVYWTEKVDSALKLSHSVKLRFYYQKLNKLLDETITVIKENNTINKIEKTKLKSIIINMLNLLDMLKKILREKAIREENFDWEAHMKYYYVEGECNIKSLEMNFKYMFEYLGITNPFIITPVTDRCLRTMINAFHLHYGGFVTGKTNTGKTETIKYLAGTLGVHLKIFFCTINHRLDIFRDLLKGTVLSGSWIFFENFTKLDQHVLSSLSQDIDAIFTAKKLGLDACSITDKIVSINPTCFLIGSIQLGNVRELLPHNLKVQFRTVTMLIPDFTRISEAFLYSYGFKFSSMLAKKLMCALDVFTNIVDNNCQLDIRRIKRVLSLCEISKLEERAQDEELILYKSIIEVFEKQIHFNHAIILKSILQDVFPGKEQPHIEFEDIGTELNLQLEKMNLLNYPNLLPKVANLCEIISRNEQVIITGKLCSGKTNLLKISKNIMEKRRNVEIGCHFINPNSLDYVTLFGHQDQTSHKWNDGVITKILRNYEYQKGELFTWMIFDGALDSSLGEHITNLVSEKNFFTDSGEMLLCLERLTIILEVENINDCSPAIITRCCIVHMDQASLTWDILVKSWAKSCKSEWIEKHQEQISDILLWLINPCLTFVSQNCETNYPLDDFVLVKTALRLTQLILDDVFSSVNHKEEDPKNFSVWIQATLVQSVLFSLTSLCDMTSKYKFDEFYKGLWKGLNQDYPYPSTLEKLEVSIPSEGLLFNYQYIYRQRGTWKPTIDLLKTEKISESAYMNEVLVPTPDTFRNSFFLNLFIKYVEPVILVGSTGKTILVEDIIINKLSESETISYQLNCSTTITPNILQSCIISKLNKGKMGKFSPPPSKNFLLYICDLNLTIMNKSGTFVSLELLRQFLDHEVLYEFENGTEIFLENINIIATVGLSNSRRKPLPSRFLRHFAVLGSNELTDETITRIYSSSLLYNWKKKNFPGDIVSVVHQIIEATLSVYKLIQVQYKPTISRSYYYFGLDCFSKILQGCSLLRKESFDLNKKIYLKLWAHEMLRIFGDRLTSLDYKWLCSKIKNCFTEVFAEEEYNELNENIFENLIFSNLNGKDNNSRRYEEIIDLKHITDIILDFIDKYNQCYEKNLDVVLFNYALNKLMAICRILSLSPGNAILLGFPGTGRQILTKLAAFIYNCKLFEPNITDDYNIYNWNSDVKLVMRESGAIANHCVFLLREEHLLEEAYLQNIDYLLRNGEVPGIYNSDETQEILELTRLSAQGGNKNVDISAATVFLYFHKVCRQNLHIILSLSYNNFLLRKIQMDYPSLMKCHIMSWNDWPDEAYQLIAYKFMQSLNIPSKDEMVNTAIYFFRHTQNHSKICLAQNKLKVKITSSSFVHFLNLFTELTEKKQKEITFKKSRYEQALTKLSHAATQIENMQKALALYQPQLAEMTQKASEMTKQIALETIEVEKASALVRKDELIASEQAIVAQRLKSECESELAQAIPILEDAISALNTLKPSDITLVKSMKNPPDAIKLVMAAVCVIKDVKPDRIPDPSTGRKIIDYWSPSKRILGDMNFLQTLKDFDKDHIKPEIMVKIRKEYLPHKDFKPHVVAKASSAAEGLCKWIIAMDMYDKVAKEVAPKKVKLEKAEKEFAETLEILNQKKEEVTRIEEKLASLNALLDDATAKQLKLQQEVDSCNKKLSSAQKLIDSLGGEKVRWNASVDNLEKQRTLLPGNLALSSGIIAYLSNLDSRMREKTINEWQIYVSENNLPCSDDFNIIKSISSENETESWLRFGLPNDNFFIGNGVIHMNSQLSCIIIDPDYVAKSWIGNTESKNNLTLTKFSNEDYLEKLRYSIGFGKPIVFHEVKEKFPAALQKFLVRNVKSIQWNGEDINVHHDFRIYILSNLRTPQFESHIYKRFCLINFSATKVGVEDEMLTIITEIEKPELRKLGKELSRKKHKQRKELLELENKILRTLCESQTDILEDEASIKILDQSKDLARIVRDKQKEVKEIEGTFEEYKEAYKNAAISASDLFFFTRRLHRINYIYQYTLTIFRDIFQRSILMSEKSKIIEKRCESVIKTFTFHIFRYISQSIFEKDKIIFLFLLTITVVKSRQKFSHKELTFLFNENYRYSSEPLPNPAPDWLQEDIWQKIQQLQCLENFGNFISSFIVNINDWRDFLKTNTLILNMQLPGQLDLTNFDKLLLDNIFHFDQKLENLITFIGRELGDDYIKNYTVDSFDIYNQSNNLCPLLLISSVTSSNLKDTVSILAEKKLVKHTFRSLSVGEDNTQKMCELIDTAREKGSWVLLENCHLSKNCFDILEKELDEMNFENTHENFRLFLTLEITQSIPLELLQKCMKIVDDSSLSLKGNLLRLYKKEPISSSKFFHSCPGKQELFAKFLYGTTFFHCILSRRAIVNNFSWNCSYIFDESDFNIAITQLAMIINESNFSVQNLEKLYYMIGQCHYMNYMVDCNDHLFLYSLLSEFVNSDMIRTKCYKFGGIQCYTFPKKMDHADFIRQIENLPSNDHPEILGLNSYIDIVFKQYYYEDIVNRTTASLKYTMPKLIEDNEFTILNYIDDLKAKVPPLIDKKTVENFIIREEIIKINMVLSTMLKSMKILKDCISGNSTISPEYEEIARDILDNKVPKIWSLQPTSVNLPFFMENLQEKVEFFKSFNETLGIYWIGAFSSPVSLIYQLKRDFSRSLKIPLHEIRLEFKILSDEWVSDKKNPVITGLRLLGAKWDRTNGKLCENLNSLYDELPSVTVFPKVYIENSAGVLCYDCPIYQNLNQDFVIDIMSLPTDISVEHWKKRNVKLFCENMCGDSYKKL